MDYNKIIDEITRINRETAAPDITLPLADLLNGEDKTIYLAVVGQFKSGKSSLINHILGIDILPVGVVPVTAIVTRIRFGKDPGLIVMYNNGEKKCQPVNELSQFVTEKFNPENSKNISQVIVEHPAAEPFKNISFVDTPGLGSIYKHNSILTRQWLPFTGAAIICVSAERPLSEEDIELINGISQYCPRSVVVITKSDLFKPKQLDEIKEYISEAVEKATGRMIPVLDHTVISGTSDSGNPLMDRVIKPLHTEHDARLQEIIKHKTRNLIEQSISYANLALCSAAKKESEKESIEKLLDTIRHSRVYHEREMLLSASAFKNDVRGKLEKIIRPYLETLIENGDKKFVSGFRHWGGLLYRVTGRFENWLRKSLSEEIKSIDEKCSDHYNEIVRECAGYFQYSAVKFRQGLDEKLGEFFGVKLPEARWQIDFTGVDTPDISIYRTFESHIDTLLFFIPAAWFKKIFYNHFRRQITAEADKNLHRYISSVTGTILKAIDNMHRQSLLFISDEIMTVENILKNTDTNYELLAENLDRLNKIRTMD